MKSCTGVWGPSAQPASSLNLGSLGGCPTANLGPIRQSDIALTIRDCWLLTAHLPASLPLTTLPACLITSNPSACLIASNHLAACLITPNCSPACLINPNHLCLCPYYGSFIWKDIRNDVWKVVRLSGLISILHFYYYRFEHFWLVN
uniref:Uncharacterized protein n=1 Tax=Myotis myotis TaxID=51298 RepID=A0A7J7Z5N3_MYOMY|nr:hypothetical protein mMyoMyo1_010624 [Myotis myotis]